MHWRLSVSKYISDVIGDIDEIIRQHGNKILIAAGVGAGKTYWVKNVLSKQGKVLFITSRRAKVDEDVRDSRFERINSMNLTENQYITTNAGIENLLKQYYLHGDNVSEILGLFDYIVVDEIHSIAVDSSFARSSFALNAFIKYATDQGKVVIGMTGTPEPMLSYFDYHDWHLIDLRKKCNYVHPNRITLIEKNEVPDLIKQCVRREKQVVYFANMRGDIPDLIQSVVKDKILHENQIAVIVGAGARQLLQDDLKEVLKGKAEKVIEQSVTTYRFITEKKIIPARCRLLICTSALREGIDIRNDDCEIICENHILTNIIQFFGRVRIGGGTAHIVTDAKQHRVDQYAMAYHYAKNSETDNLNAYLRSIRSNRRYSQNEDYTLESDGLLRRNLGPEDILKFADFIEAGNDYIYFDYIKAWFYYFDIKYKEERRVISKLQRSANGEPVWKSDLKVYCQTYEIKLDNIVGNRQEEERRRLHDELEEYAASSTRLYKEYNQHEPLVHLIQSTLNCACRRISALNEQLTIAGIPYRIESGRGTTVFDRNKSYWKVIRLN